MNYSTKESSHKCNKTYNSCFRCLKDQRCSKCKGICIFAQASLKNCEKSQGLQTMLSSKYLSKEFAFLSAQKNFSLANHEEDENNIDNNLKLLRMYHTLNPESKKQLLKLHCTDPYLILDGPYCRFSKLNQIKGNYSIYHFPVERHPSRFYMGRESRQYRNKKLIQHNIHQDLSSL